MSIHCAPRIAALMPNKEENVQIALTRTLMIPWSTSTNESLPSLRQQLSAFNSRPPADSRGHYCRSWEGEGGIVVMTRTKEGGVRRGLIFFTFFCYVLVLTG